MTAPDTVGQCTVQRTFLFLQGPHGPFFPNLGHALAKLGYRVIRVNFNGGDAATWPDGINYRSTFDRWPAYVRELIERESVTDLLVYGDARPLHAVAIGIAHVFDVSVHVFEEGYIRPDWVTMERDGVNGNSTLPRDPAWYRRKANTLPPLPDHPVLPNFSVTRQWAALFYYIDIVLQAWRFPFHRGHRKSGPLHEAIAYLRRYLLKGYEARQSARAAVRLAGHQYMLFPLQLDTDYQIRHHSPFGTMSAAITHVLASFARHSPPDLRLAVKEHPLDVGIHHWGRMIRDLATTMGIADRVVFLEQGVLDELVTGAVGVVTVNSTSGTLALAMGKPVKVIGYAVYGIADITYQGSLDEFWSAPVPPDKATYEAFCRVLGAYCLLPGAFLSRVGANALIAATVARLLDGGGEIASSDRRMP